MSKYLDFQELVPSGRKTKIIRVLSKNNVLLGDISFWPAWRKYMFNPASGTMFDDKCLKEIVNKLDEMNIEIRQEWANRRKSNSAIVSDSKLKEEDLWSYLQSTLDTPRILNVF